VIRADAQVVHDGSAERSVSIVRRWRVRLISDQLSHRVGTAPMADFLAVLDRELELWVAAQQDPDRRFARQASGPGLDLEVSGDLTLGLQHVATVVVKPGDHSVARWHCTCGVTSRGSSNPERARMDADEHVGRESSLPSARPRWTDIAVAQDSDGGWAQVPIKVARRLRITARSDFSLVHVHRMGTGEDFELVIDGRLGLWVRVVGEEGALRKDRDGRGVTLVVLSDDA
jgi:hypothetical protein